MYMNIRNVNAGCYGCASTITSVTILIVIIINEIQYAFLLKKLLKQFGKS